VTDIDVDVITPDDIDEGYVPHVREDVVAVEAGTETVLLGRFGQAVLLNPTAGLVWRFFDGESALGDLIDDFAAVLDEEVDTVRHDIIAFARVLGRVGLLDGVAPPIAPTEAIPVEWSPPEPVEVGEPLGPVALTDLDGHPVSLDAWRGRRVLFVNWSPGCGFCVMIGAALADAEEGLSAEGIDLVLLTQGDADDNRRVLDGADLHATALLRDGDDDPFEGFGTPAAYLLDVDGRVEEPMAYGAVDVPRRAAELAGLEPDEPTGAATDDDELDETLYLPAPSAVCGPGGGGSTSTGWAGTAAYRIGDFHVGIRYNDPATAAALDRLLPGARVQDRRTPDNYSIALYPTVGTGSRRLNLLVRGGSQLVRSRSAARALSALLNHLTADTTPPDEHLLALDATAGVVGDRAILLPPGLVNWTKQIQTKLARRGIVLVDTPFITIDPVAGELVVPIPSVPHDSDVLDELDDGARLAPELPHVGPGRYPIAAWYLNRGPDEVGPLSPGQAVASAYGRVATDADPGRVGRQLALVFDQVAAYGIWLDRPAALDEQLDPQHWA
jgi:hypothetical protein